MEQLKAEYGQCENIEFSAALEQRELVRHYQSASALILPSLAPETFGLTVVEAFACGTPVLVNGQRVPLTGRGVILMKLLVDLSQVPKTARGGKVSLIQSQADGAVMGGVDVIVRP